MTTQEQQPANETVDSEILREIGTLLRELLGFKRLVLKELLDIKERLTTLTDGDPVREPTTGEDNRSALVPPGAALTEAPAPARPAIHEQPVVPDAQEPSTDKSPQDEDDDGPGQ